MGTGMVASSGTFRTFLERVIQDVSIAADCQWGTLVSPLNSSVNAATSVQSLILAVLDP